MRIGVWFEAFGYSSPSLGKWPSVLVSDQAMLGSRPVSHCLLRSYVSRMVCRRHDTGPYT